MLMVVAGENDGKTRYKINYNSETNNLCDCSTLSGPVQSCTIALGLGGKEAGCDSQAPVLEGGWHRIQLHCGISAGCFTTDAACTTHENQNTNSFCRHPEMPSQLGMTGAKQ